MSSQKDSKIQHRHPQVETRVLPRGSYEERQNNAATQNNVSQAQNLLAQLQQQASGQNNGNSGK